MIQEIKNSTLGELDQSTRLTAPSVDHAVNALKEFLLGHAALRYSLSIEDRLALTAQSRAGMGTSSWSLPCTIR